METIAVYWEQRVKIYGFQEKKALSFMKFHFSSGGMSAMGAWLRRLGGLGLKYHLVLTPPVQTPAVGLYLLVDIEHEDRLKTEVRSIIPDSPQASLQIISPVESLHFHGPHFGDRYGIVTRAYKTLTEKNIKILASACSSNSVYLILAEGGLDEAKKHLSEVYEVPGGGSSTPR